VIKNCSDTYVRSESINGTIGNFRPLCCYVEGLLILFFFLVQMEENQLNDRCSICCDLDAWIGKSLARYSFLYRIDTSQ
jgi:hypothetical protein